MATATRGEHERSLVTAIAFTPPRARGRRSFTHAPTRHMVVALACGMSAIAVLNVVRTLASHDFAVDRASSTFGEQVLASKNVVGHPLLRELWAPLGLRHHALRRLFPAVPHHALGEVSAGCRRRCLLESALYRRATFGSWCAARTSENRSDRSYRRCRS